MNRIPESTLVLLVGFGLMVEVLDRNVGLRNRTDFSSALGREGDCARRGAWKFANSDRVPKRAMSLKRS
jgi:hypothetical protein